MSDQRCGTCKWFTDHSNLSGYEAGEGRCLWAQTHLPTVWIFQQEARTTARLGEECSQWEEP